MKDPGAERSVALAAADYDKSGKSLTQADTSTCLTQAQVPCNLCQEQCAGWLSWPGQQVQQSGTAEELAKKISFPS